MNNAEEYMREDAKTYADKARKPMNAIRFAKLWKNLCKPCKQVCWGKVARKEIINPTNFCDACKPKVEKALGKMNR